MEGAAEAELYSLVRLGGQVLAVKLDHAGSVGEPSESVDRGGLASAVGADQADDGALGNIERDIIDSHNTAVGHSEVSDGQHRRQARHVLRCQLAQPTLQLHRERFWLATKLAGAQPVMEFVRHDVVWNGDAFGVRNDREDEQDRRDQLIPDRCRRRLGIEDLGGDKDVYEPTQTQRSRGDTARD